MAKAALMNINQAVQDVPCLFPRSVQSRNNCCSRYASFSTNQVGPFRERPVTSLIFMSWTFSVVARAVDSHPGSSATSPPRSLPAHMSQTQPRIRVCLEGNAVKYHHGEGEETFASHLT